MTDIITDTRKPSKASTPINLPNRAREPLRVGPVLFISAAPCLALSQTAVGYSECVRPELHLDPTFQWCQHLGNRRSVVLNLSSKILEE